MTEFLRSFDGVASRTIFCMWTGTNPLPPPRMAGILAMLDAVRCPLVFVTHRSLRDWEKSGAPFHPAFEHLSETHKADYLRCYLMHHFGGGYSDIKLTMKRWDLAFDALATSPAHTVLGYPEIGPEGVAPVGGEEEQALRANWRSLIGCGAFICKKNTKFTNAWLARVNSILDSKLESLRAHPARDPRDVSGMRLVDGTTSPYPLRWSEIMGEVFHPTVFSLRDEVLQHDITPIFQGYR